MQTYWLSFVDHTLPAGQRCIGICIVDAYSPKDAVQESWLRGCNPGGEVAWAIMPSHLNIPESHRNRLIPRDEALQLAKEY